MRALRIIREMIDVCAAVGMSASHSAKGGVGLVFASPFELGYRLSRVPVVWWCWLGPGMSAGLRA